MNELMQSIKDDLLSRRLLPVLVLLGLALIGAVAYAASGSGGSPSAGAPAAAGAPPSAQPRPSALSLTVASANPNEAVAETPRGTHFQTRDTGRNPFTPLVSAKAAKAASTGPSAKKGGSSASSKSSSGAATGGSAPKQPSPVPVPVKPAPKPKHAGLTSMQSYSVALSLTTQGGNLDAIESLERLSALPSQQQPLLVYLGVLQGGRDALFVVQPGTVVSGPGACTPGPTDCEVLSLAPNQIESLATAAGTNVALFAVTAIRAESHRTVAAANRARREAAASGRTLLQGSTLPALALFEYQLALGVVVDLRNLSVGGEK